MARPPYTLEGTTSYEDVLARVNENFANVAADVSDLGSFRTSPVTFTLSLGASGSGTSETFGAGNIVVDKGSRIERLFLNGISSITGRMEVFIDTDNDDTYSWPLGSNVSTLQLLTNFYINRRNFSSADPTKTVIGSWVYELLNQDGSAHTFYLHFDFDFFPKQPR